MQKTLHFMWFQGLTAAPPELQDMPRKWKAMNPDYTVKVWDEKEILTFVASVFPTYLAFFKNIGFGEAPNIAVIKKCDFARLLILFAFGGAYVDLDCVPVRPISTLLDGGAVEHSFTKFEYSRNNSFPSKLKDRDALPIQTDFSKYELIVSREHCHNPTLGGFPIANTVMFGRAGSSLLSEMIVGCVANVKEKVLAFAGPFGLSKYLKGRVHELAGRVLTLPPYYFLWQLHDMGPAWKNTVCCHLNRMDWVDWSNPEKKFPWDI